MLSTPPNSEHWTAQLRRETRVKIVPNLADGKSWSVLTFVVSDLSCLLLCSRTSSCMSLLRYCCSPSTGVDRKPRHNTKQLQCGTRTGRLPQHAPPQLRAFQILPLHGAVLLAADDAGPRRQDGVPAPDWGALLAHRQAEPAPARQARLPPAVGLPAVSDLLLLVWGDTRPAGRNHGVHVFPS